jgi:hypothetical protein
MSERVEVIAVYGLDAYGLADLFPSVPQEAFASSGDWAWLRLVPDGPAAALDPEEVATRLGGCDRPALDIRAEADDHWRLSVYAPQDRALHVAFHHEVYRPSTLPPGPNARLPVDELLNRLDAPLPEAFRTPGDVLEKCRDKPRGRGLTSVKKAQARRVKSLLEALKLPVGSELGRVLSGEECSADELLKPYGTLPKFLDSVWLGKVLAEDDGGWKVGPTAESNGTYNRERPLYRLAPPAVPVDGGPVELPATDLERFWLLPWFCETDAETDILITPPPGSRVHLPKTEYWVTVHRRTGRAYVEVAWNPPGPRYRVYQALGRALAESPAGTVVEFASGNTSEEDDDSGYTPLRAGGQRYSGTLTDRGTFLLTHASVPARPEHFRAAMEICRAIGERGFSFEMPSEQDARAVRELARCTDWFADEKDLPRVKGKKVVAASRAEALTTAMMVFRRWFAAGPWDTGAVQEREEQSHQDWEEMIDKVGKTVGEALAAPAGDDVILKTDRAVFRRADWSKLNVGVLDAIGFLWGRAAGEDVDAPETPLQKLEPVDRAFTEIGFVPLGDVHCDRFGELYLRGYAGPDGDTYGCVVAGTFGQFLFEFVTRFDDGGSLTTSTTPNLEDKRKRRIFKRSFPKLNPDGLYQKHRLGIAEITSKAAKPLPAEATVGGFCRAIDEYIRREL